MTLADRVRRDARRAQGRVRGKLVWEADRFVGRHISAFERLGRLTPIAASQVEPRLLFDTSDREMGPHIWTDAGYEEADLAWILEHLGHPQQGRTVVEVGGNVGTTTVPLLVRFGAQHVETFEPASGNIKLLRCNLILNDLEDRVVVHPLAVSDRNGSVTLELCDWNTGDHRIQALDSAWEVFNESAWATTVVDARRLEEALSANPSDVGLVWVDTQGHESHVLAGASTLLDRGIPWVIEYWPYGLTRAGGLDRLHATIAEHFSVAVDVRASRVRGTVVRMAPERIPELGAELGTGYTDLILLEA
ncbi:MAG: FkbM family methyltransferase [Actinomycetota bacterium]|nr:FkbM family methyltransferase [Actinomycetota bacterium]